jgi:hypothetical protein
LIGARDLSNVTRRQKAHQAGRDQRRGRSERDSPCVATLALSDAVSPNGANMKKRVGPMAAGFEQRDVPHYKLKQNMAGQVRR